MEKSNRKMTLRVRKVKGEKNYYEIFDPSNKKNKWNLIPREIPPEKLRKTDVRRQGDGVAIVTGKDGLIYWIGGKGRWLGYRKIEENRGRS